MKFTIITDISFILFALFTINDRKSTEALCRYQLPSSEQNGLNVSKSLELCSRCAAKVNKNTNVCLTPVLDP